MALAAFDEVDGPGGAGGGGFPVVEGHIDVSAASGFKVIEGELESLEQGAFFGNPGDEMIFRRSAEAGLEGAGDERGGIELL